MEKSFKILVPEHGFVWRVAHWLKGWAQQHAANELIANSICLYPAEFFHTADDSTSEELMAYLDTALAAGWRFENAITWWPYSDDLHPGTLNSSINKALKARATSPVVAILSEPPMERSVEVPISRSKTQACVVHCKSREYDLMEDKYRALFISFKDLPLTARGFLEFAKQHGSLDNLHSHALSHNNLDTLARWQYEVITMRQAFMIWEYLKKANKANRESSLLAKHFKWQIHRTEKCRCVIYDSHPEMDAGTTPSFPEFRMIKAICWEGDSHWAELQDENPKTAAQWFIREIINRHIADQADSILTWIDEPPKGRARKRTEITPATVRMSRQMRPRNLIGALWVQFENAFLGNMKFEQCGRDGCPYWVEGRSNKEYCGASCRKIANRKLHDDVQAMDASGMSIKQIAKKLGLEEDRVKTILNRQQGDRT